MQIAVVLFLCPYSSRETNDTRQLGMLSFANSINANKLENKNTLGKMAAPSNIKTDL